MRLNALLESIGLASCARDREVEGLQSLENANDRELSFIEKEQYLSALERTKAGAVFMLARFASFAPKSCLAIVCDDPHLYMAKASAFFERELVDDGKEAVVGDRSRIYGTVGKDTKIGANTLIMHGAVIGDRVTIGDDVVIYPNVTIYNDTSIGNRARIHAGCVIGSDGFGYAHTKTGEHVKIYHLGRAVIEDDVEIGANTTIDRAVFGETIIRRGTKIDNLAHIGHNCDIGEYSIIVAQVGIAGSVKTGRNLVTGGQVGIAGHLTIADFVTLAAKSGVSKSIGESGTYAGFPLMNHRAWLKLQAKISALLKH
ncbi:MAG: UDP-3-O-(3-hydroxymyristoyl)glucosamine N-acyltransferase [Helicobacteraceae bacterium]|jgi:UDP-3-O-[3-hydroxymyristoyl] glucosamine N-acyltransferase|nr:UDP-3-O-(3-hydroxymyristoyl)glucosamine N-acyltransferase [Helicobacteraceae bacterium]